MNKIKLKVMEWNLHGMTGFNGKGNVDYFFPSKLIIKNINRLKPDIIVFTEFCSFRFGEGWNDTTKKTVIHRKDDVDKLKKWFDRKGYILQYSEHNDGKDNKKCNDVGIAIKNSINIINNEENEVNKQRKENWPDYMDVCCKIKQSKFYVMGVRIKPVGDKDREKQFDNVIDEINGKKMPVIALGDFNNGPGENLYTYMKTKCEENKPKLHLYTPGWKGSGDKQQLDFGVFSYNNGWTSLMKIDHMITSFDAKISDLNDRKQIGYDWGFIGDVYNNFRNYNEVNNSFRNIPDHAIFYAEITLPENY